MSVRRSITLSCKLLVKKYLRKIIMRDSVYPKGLLSFCSIHRLYVDSLSFRRLMPSGLLGQPLAGRLSAILADVSTNCDRKPTTQCPWKEYSSTHVNHKDSSETIERIPEETGP